MPSALNPTVNALLFSTGVYRDLTRLVYLLGIFNGFCAEVFPAPMPRSYVYLSVTDGHGPVELTMRLVDAADDDATPLFEFDVPPALFRSPLDVKEVVAEVPPVTFTKSGVYRWQVVCGGAVIHERRLVATRAGD
jgi:hypothetical protein